MTVNYLKKIGCLCFIIFLGNYSLVFAITEKLDLDKLINRFSNRIVEAAVSAARSQAEVSYSSVTYNPTLKTIFLNNLHVTPFNRTDLAGCYVSIGSVGISLYRNEFKSIDFVEVGLTDLNVSQMCIPFEFRGFLALAGVREIDIPFLKLDFSHAYPSSETTVTLSGGLTNVASITANLELSYLSFSPDSSVPFIARLKNFSLTLQNNGIWEAISSQLPPAFTTPGQAGIGIESFIRTSLKERLSSVSIEKIIKNTVPAIDNFVNNPESLTLSVKGFANQSTEIDFDAFKNFEKIINDLQPTIYANKLIQKNRQDITNEKLLSVLKGDTENLSKEELIIIGEKLMSGRGVPKNIKESKSIFQELANKEHSKAFFNLAKIAIEEKEFDVAYYNAIKFSSHKTATASTLINKIESEMSLEKILEVQYRFLPEIMEKSKKIERDFFDVSMAHLNGSRATKSYLGAYYFSLLALAKGDVRADSILNKIEKISKRLSGEPLKVWNKNIYFLQSKATSHWIKNN